MIQYEYRQTQHERFAGIGSEHREGRVLEKPSGDEWELVSWAQDSESKSKMLVVWRRAQGAPKPQV
jgi:hypothetical protein